MEEGGPSFGKNFSEMCRHVIAFFKVRKGSHWGPPSPPHHHRDQRGGQGRGGKSLEECGGEFGWRESEGGELAPFVFLFSPATCLFWVFPSQLPNKGKNAQIKKTDQR